MKCQNHFCATSTKFVCLSECSCEAMERDCTARDVTCEAIVRLNTYQMYIYYIALCGCELEYI